MKRLAAEAMLICFWLAAVLPIAARGLETQPLLIPEEIFLEETVQFRETEPMATEETQAPEETEPTAAGETQEPEQTQPPQETEPEVPPGIVINGVDIGYWDGSYFTKDGNSCANDYWPNGRCHNNNVCTTGVHEQCNCMRYWPTGDPATCQVDLLGAQCLSYARYCQWRAYGVFAIGATEIFGDLTGVMEKADCTPEALKEKLLDCPPATHLRMRGTHSVSILSTSDTGLTYTECNTDGYCRVDLVSSTWELFSAYVQRKNGIAYTYAYREGQAQPDCGCDSAYAGSYVCTTQRDNLNVRSSHTSSSTSVGSIPPGATVTVTMASGTGSSDWGHVLYNHISGYASMAYLRRIEEASPEEKEALLPGDVNHDGSVNTVDRMVLTRHLAGWSGYPASELDLEAADVNEDGIVNTLDRMILTRHLAQWSGYETLPWCS